MLLYVATPVLQSKANVLISPCGRAIVKTAPERMAKYILPPPNPALEYIREIIKNRKGSRKRDILALGDSRH